MRLSVTVIGPPRGDLPLKQRYYGAVGAKDISKSNRHEISAAVSFHGLENHLAKPFAGAHYRGGIDRFDCGNQKELLNAELIRGPHEIQCAKHIVADRLLGALFHERHMFVRSGMKNHIRPVCTEDLPHPLPVPYGSNLHFQIEPPAILIQQFLLNVIGVVLIDVHDHQLFGIVLDNLAAQL